MALRDGLPPMLDTVILHMGATKTGTSAIQSALSINRDRLSDLGYFYPEAKREEQALEGKVSSGNLYTLNTLHRALGRRSFDPSSVDDYFDEVTAAADGRSVIFSGERMGGYHPDFSQLMVDALRRRFKRIKAIYFVRHVVDHAVSQYGEAVKRRGETKGFLFYSRNRHACKFEDRASRAVTTFGRENVDVVLYDDIAGRIFEGFLDAVGIPSEGMAPPVQVNRSLSASELLLIRRLNELGVSKSLVTRIVSDFSVRAPRRGDALVISQASVDSLAKRTQSVIDYINREFTLSSPLKLISDRVPIGDEAEPEPDAQTVEDMLTSAIRVADNLTA